MFQGLREFRTTVAELLREDLRRFNQALERAFSDVEKEKAPIWRTVKTSEAEYRAQHWEAVKAATTQDAIVFLPKSDPARAGHCVRVTRGPAAGTFYALTVAAQAGETINGSASLTIGVGFGFREYMDQGDGTWFSTPAI